MEGLLGQPTQDNGNNNGHPRKIEPFHGKGQDTEDQGEHDIRQLPMGKIGPHQTQHEDDGGEEGGGHKGNLYQPGSTKYTDKTDYDVSCYQGVD